MPCRFINSYVTIYHSIWCNIPKHLASQHEHCENRKSHYVLYLFAWLLEPRSLTEAMHVSINSKYTWTTVHVSHREPVNYVH
jgi:hypothetical protein